jgi:splicing factor 3B subunit 3
MTKGVFISHPDETLYVIGSVANMTMVPKSWTAGFISVYRVTSEKKFELVQKTEIEAPPYGVCAFQGRLLVGLGQTLRVYELGKKKLLRKSETKAFPHNIMKIETQGDRIYVSDATESVHFCLYRHYDNQIVIFADDFIPRWTTCSTVIDYDTVAGGDKFGNIFILRLDAEVSKAMDEDTTGSLAIYERGYLNAAPNKLSHKVDFHVGESITSVQKTTLVPGGREVILYTTLLGTIGLLVPFSSKDDIEFMGLLEMTMRQHCVPLCGQNHLAYRSTFTPVSHCIDGDLCEMFNLLPNETKRIVSAGLDRTTSEIAKKLEDLRNRVAF